MRNLLNPPLEGATVTGTQVAAVYCNHDGSHPNASLGAYDPRNGCIKRQTGKTNRPYQPQPYEQPYDRRERMPRADGCFTLNGVRYCPQSELDEQLTPNIPHQAITTAELASRKR